jgi:hypothetical protein
MYYLKIALPLNNMIEFLTILSEETQQELMMAAAGHKLTAIGHQVLGRQVFYEISLTTLQRIGAVTYNSLTGKYCNLCLHLGNNVHN